MIYNLNFYVNILLKKMVLILMYLQILKMEKKLKFWIKTNNKIDSTILVCYNITKYFYNKTLVVLGFYYLE